MKRVGSLFAGYGGSDLAVASIWPDAHPAWFVEYDKHPSAILTAHWPDVPNYGDVTTVDWSKVEPVDILTGGYPCQPFSHAGQRKGTDDERHLFPYVATAISVLRPRLVLLENVAGHLSLGGPDVIGTLTRMGYGVRWGVVRASDTGAPHRRARLFIVATDRDADSPVLSDGTQRRSGVRSDLGKGADSCGTGATAADPPHADGSIRTGAGRGAEPTHSTAADTDGASREARQHTGHHSQRVRQQPEGCAAADTDSSEPERQLPGGGVPERGPSPSDQLRLLPAAAELLPTPTIVTNSNSETPDEWLARRADVIRRTGTHHGLPLAVAAVSIGEGRPISQSDPMASNTIPPAPSLMPDLGAYGPAIARWEHVLGRPAPAPTEPGVDGRPRLNPAFVEWMMGLPQGWVTDSGIPRSAQLKALGNGIVPQQMALALRLLLDMDGEPISHDDRLLGTPTAAMSVCSDKFRRGTNPTPAELVEMLPTPQASDAFGAKPLADRSGGQGYGPGLRDIGHLLEGDDA